MSNSICCFGLVYLLDSCQCRLEVHVLLHFASCAPLAQQASVRAIARAHPRAVWVTPLGNGAYIAPLGVSRVRELDWWQDVGLTKGGEALTLVCTPAQHRTGGGVARSECPRP